MLLLGSVITLFPTDQRAPGLISCSAVEIVSSGEFFRVMYGFSVSVSFDNVLPYHIFRMRPLHFATIGQGIPSNCVRVPM